MRVLQLCDRLLIIYFRCWKFMKCRLNKCTPFSSYPDIKSLPHSVYFESDKNYIQIKYICSCSKNIINVHFCSIQLNDIFVNVECLSLPLYVTNALLFLLTNIVLGSFYLYSSRLLHFISILNNNGIMTLTKFNDH